MNSTSRISGIGLTALLLTLMSACGGGSNQPTVPQTTQEPLQVGAALPQPIEPNTDASDGKPTTQQTPVEAVEEAVVEAVEEPTDIAGSNNPPTTAADLTGDVACDAATTAIQSRMLALINEARASARNCGDTLFPAVAALTWNQRLENAAAKHSEDMSKHNFFSHIGSDGSSAALRATTADYNWMIVGENIAAGQSTATLAVEGWLESPGHCANIMEERFTEMAVSCASNDDSDFREYWTQVLGQEQ